MSETATEAFRILTDDELKEKSPKDAEAYYAEARRRCTIDDPIVTLFPENGDFLSASSVIAQAVEKKIAQDEESARRAILLAVSHGYVVHCSHHDPGKVGYRKHPHCCSDGGAKKDWLEGK